MRIAYTKERCLKRAPKEESGFIGCGTLALVPPLRDGEDSRFSDCDYSRVAFGRLVQLSRRGQRLSVEEFAEKADIDVTELLNIERTACIPEPRTVHQLSGILNIGIKKLLQLSGLTKEREAGLVEEAVRFAARSESLEKLSAEEVHALEHFVSVLSEKR